MPTEIAREDLGLCPSCGTRIERGEWVTTKDGPTRHTGCPSWRGIGNITKPGGYPQSGFLFSIADEAVIYHAREVLTVKTISFDGASAMQIDVPRLALQLTRVFELMKDSQPRTLQEIASATGMLETSASARLRDFRKKQFGAHQALPHKRSSSPLVYEYRLILNTTEGTDEQRTAA
jgi:hypothetical protein